MTRDDDGWTPTHPDPAELDPIPDYVLLPHLWPHDMAQAWTLHQDRLWVDYWGNLLLLEMMPCDYLRAVRSFVGATVCPLTIGVSIILAVRGEEA